MKALKQLHGDSGAAIPFDVLKYENMEAILRVQSRFVHYFNYYVETGFATNSSMLEKALPTARHIEMTKNMEMKQGFKLFDFMTDLCILYTVH